MACLPLISAASYAYSGAGCSRSLFATWLLLWRREDRKREEEELWGSDRAR